MRGNIFKEEEVRELKRLVYLYKRINGAETLITNGNWALKGGSNGKTKKEKK